MQPYLDDATQVSTETSCQISTPVILVGNGRVDPALIRAARSCEHTLVAADGGADRLLALGMVPDVIVGDLDSLRDRGAFPSATGIIHVRDQDSSDLQKCLRVLDAPFFLCTGFVGSRYDHSLSLPHVFLAETKRTFVFVEGDDVIFRLPDRWLCELPPATRLSLYPLRPTRATSTGLLYPLDDLLLEVGTRIGTSNSVAESPVSVTIDEGALMGMAPRERYAAVVRSLSLPFFLSIFG